MSGREKGTGKCADILDCIYENKKLTVFGPLALAGVVLLLFVIFGQNADKWIMVRDSLNLAAILYGSVLLVIGFELWNPFCKPQHMDFFIVFFTLGMAFGVAQQLLVFLFHLRTGFHIGLPGFCLVPNALALIQSKRK